MCCNNSIFQNIKPYNNKASIMLCDGETKYIIEGIGNVTVQFEGHNIILLDILYSHS